MKIFHTSPSIADLLTTLAILAVGFVVMVLIFLERYENGAPLIDWNSEFPSFMLCVGWGILVGWFARAIIRKGE